MSKWLVVLFGVVLCLSACGAPMTYTAQNAGVTVQITLSRSPRVNDSQAATIIITRDGNRIDAQNVVCDMQMPGMTMGANRPIADKGTDGTLTCGLLFTMSGEWAVIIHGEYASQPFRVVVPHILVSE